MALKWETIDKASFLGNSPKTLRTKVPGGWFVAVFFVYARVFFYPDPEHLWDGSSLP